MKTGKFATVLKWVGYGTAILSLIAGIRETGKVVADHLESRRKIESLLASEQIQLQGRDYRSAWRSLDQASQVNPESAEVRSAQETLAMEWLENISVGENEKFSDIVEKLEPVLTRGAASAKDATRQADLLAHLGWSYFLRSREGETGVDPAGPYAEAVKKDRNNPYAQAMWGHWILWNLQDPGEAAPHFSSALASNRQRAYVRRVQLSALLNVRSSQCDREIVRVLNAVRKEQGLIGPEMQREIFGVYNAEILPSDAGTTRFVSAVPPAEHITTFRWLFDKRDLDESDGQLRIYYLSVLQEAAGQRDEALAGYQSIRQQMLGRPGSLLNLAEAGIKRLSST